MYYKYKYNILKNQRLYVLMTYQFLLIAIILAISYSSLSSIIPIINSH